MVKIDVPLSCFRTSVSKQFEDCVRIAFCYYSKEVLTEAAGKIVKAVKTLQSRHK